MKKFKIKSNLGMLFLSICFSLIISYPASANKVNDTNNKSLFDSYKGRSVQSVIIVENGIARNVTQSEYDEILNKREKMDNLKDVMSLNKLRTLSETYTSNDIKPQNYNLKYDFDKWGEDDWHPRSMTKIVTPKIYAGRLETDIGYTNSIAVNVTIGGSFGGSYEIKKLITAALTIDYSQSSEKSESFDLGATVPVGYTGWIEFTPRMANIWGKITRTESFANTSTSTYSDSFFPVKVGKYADGIYEVVIVKGNIR